MKKILFLLAFTCTCINLDAQNEASNWHFGSGAGLTFDLLNNTVTPITSAVNTNEGCSSISAADGTVLFYTDGRSVWDANNNIMPNADYDGGSGLLGDPSSTSSGLIVPKPNDPNLYYIFTVDEPHHNNAWAYPNQGPADINGNQINFYDEIGNNDPNATPAVDDGFNNGLAYSLIDLSLNGGNGDVVTTEKNVPLITYDISDPIESSYKCSEKITAVAADDCESIWVITHFEDKFYSFKIDNNGVNPTPEISEIIGDVNITTEGYRRNAIGYIKASPDGSKIAICHNRNATIPGNQNEASASGSFWVYDFDNATGLVSNGVELLTNINAYGTEFSSDSNKVYVSSSGAVNQFDLENMNQQTTILSSSNGFLGAMQLAPNGKIYVINTSNANFLDVIENPNEAGFASNYNQNGQALAAGSNSNLGLPPFISSFFVERIDIIQDNSIDNSTLLSLCEGDTFTLIADDLVGANYTWTRDGNVIDDGNANAFDLEIVPDQGGLYEVLIQQNNGDCNTFEGQALVTFFDVPVANDLIDEVACDANNDGISSFDFTSKNSEALDTQDNMQYTVRYFADIDDANNNINELSFPYLNTTNPQEIFVRVENVDNTDCFDINSFMLTVFDAPIVNSVAPIDECDLEGDTTDGIVTLTLSDYTSTALGIQDPMDYTLTYHDTDADAQSGNSPLPDSYPTQPFNDEVFIRVVNNANNECFATGSFTINIDLTPEVNDIRLFQCDEDGSPDGRTVFNIVEKENEITGANPDFDVDYYLDINAAMSETDPIDAANFSNTANPQIIIARVTDTTTDCFSLSEVTLEVSVTTANDARLGICDTDDVEDGFVEFDLSMANDQVLDGLPAGLDLAYYLTLDDALLEVNPLPNFYTNAEVDSQIIFVRVENDNDCFGINEVELEVLTLPNVITEDETLYCLNNFPEPITLNGGVFDAVPNNFLYNWSTGETTIEIEVNQPGTYTVEVSNVQGCSKTRTIIVNQSNIATIDNIEVTDATSNNTVTVLVSGEGDYEYALDNPNGAYQDSNVFNNIQPGIYTVFVRDRNGCGISEELISVVGFPKFFTPNGDNQNDFWQVRGISDQFQPNTVIYIFDKYGKLLSEINPLGSGWDGTYNGNLMPSSDYWFSVTLQDGRRFSSHFSLKR